MSFQNRKTKGRKLLGVGISRTKRNKKWCVPYGSSFGTSEDHFQNPSSQRYSVGESGRNQAFANFGHGNRSFGHGSRDMRQQESNVDASFHSTMLRDNMIGGNQTLTNSGHGSMGTSDIKGYIKKEIISAENNETEKTSEDSHYSMLRGGGAIGGNQTLTNSGHGSMGTSDIKGYIKKEIISAENNETEKTSEDSHYSMLRGGGAIGGNQTLTNSGHGSMGTSDIKGYIKKEIISAENNETEKTSEDSHYSMLRGGGAIGREKSTTTTKIKEEKDTEDKNLFKRSGYERPPPWLKGKEIGLWHRDRYRRMREKGELPEKITKKPHPIEIHLEESKELEIRSMLNSIKSEFPYPIQRSIPRPSVMENLVTAMEWDEESSTPTVIKKDPDQWTEVTYKKERHEKLNMPFPESIQVQSANDKYKHLQESAFKKKFLRSITGSIEENVMNSLGTQSKLKRNPQLDEELKKKLNYKMNSKRFVEMLRFRTKLPAFDKRQEILNLLKKNQVVVISGETGCGKTTQVAQFILDYEILKGNGSVTHVVCTQPRRISAVSVAERVADERDEPCGHSSVGYQIRLERQLPHSVGSILYCTTGILLTFMASDPALREISHLILDEIHERDTICDFVITILKDVIPKRPDLKVILMSATLNADSFSKYYNNCPMLHIPGFTFPVKQFYLEDVFEMTGYCGKVKKVPYNKKGNKLSKKREEERREYFEMIGPYIRQCKAENKYSAATFELLQDPESEDIDLELILALIEHICLKEDEGAILVFLPGWDKISALHKMIQRSMSLPRSKCLVIPLHSMMPTITQKSVFNRPPKGVRKIVIATNIAETSITIDDVVFVVDCGKIKMHNFDCKNNISTLKEEWVSLANAKQRKGRAGRVQDGICYHLFTRPREQSLCSYPLPEMLRTRLEEVILQAKMLQVGLVTPFLKKVMDPPDPKAIQLSLELLLTLNALDENENLTPLGFHLAKLPLDPQTGKMILMGAIFSCVDPIFSVAASLSFKDAFVIPLEKEHLALSKKRELAGATKSDHLAIAEAISGWEAAELRGFGRQFADEYFLSYNTVSLLCDMKRQFAQNLCEMKFLREKNEKDYDANIHSNNIGLIKAIICAGLYPNVAIIKHLKVSKKGIRRRSIVTPEDGAVSLHIRSVNDQETEFESRFLMYHLKLKSTSVFLHDSTMVFPLPLLFFGQKFEISLEGDDVIIYVSKDIRFTCSESTALLIKELRQRLDWLLEKKVSHPGVTNWSLDSDEGILLRAIIKLISYEERQLTNIYDPEVDTYEYKSDGNFTD